MPRTFNVAANRNTDEIPVDYRNLRRFNTMLQIYVA